MDDDFHHNGITRPLREAKPMPCPSKTELLDCLLGKLPEPRSEQLLEHAEHCPDCNRWIRDADEQTDGLVASLRVDHQTDVGSSVHCERMIQRAEQIIPSHTEAVDSPLDTIESKRHLLEGTRVRDYEILHPIGEGGMGAVFLAKHVRLNRNVAIKVLSLGRQRNSEAQQRFEQEMQIVGQLQHSGIVQALDAGEDHGIQYLVMEVIDGIDLQRLIQRVGPLDLADACEITFQVAKALEYAHSRKLIHRDIKPSNIMLSREGVVKVMDLGIAKFADQQPALTSTQQALGSLDFMAPEQLQAKHTDGRADVFALGCTLHFLLSGEPPAKRRTASLLVSKSPKLDGLRHTLPPPLTRLLQQMLLPNPAERCESMTEVADRIRPYCGSADLHQLAAKSAGLGKLEDQGHVESLTSEIPKRQPGVRRIHPILYGAFAALMLLGTLAFSLLSPLLRKPRMLSDLPSVSSNVEPVREIPLFQLHQGAIRSAAYCEETSQLILGGDDRSISIRDLPNQRRIDSLQASDAPIVALAVAHGLNRFVAMDASGSLRAFDLPQGDVAWTSTTNMDRPRRMEVTLQDEVHVWDAADHRRAFRVSDGVEISLGDTSPTDHDTWRQLAAEQFQLADGQVDHAQPFPSGNGHGWIVSHDRRAWVLDARTDTQEGNRTYFVYAEHEAPITALLCFEADSLVLTADATGQVRLWQAPNTRYSDMLLSCLTRIDSMEMTFALRRNRWNQSEFTAAMESDAVDDPAGELRMKTTVERDTVEHILQYRVVNPDP